MVAIIKACTVHFLLCIIGLLHIGCSVTFSSVNFDIGTILKYTHDQQQECYETNRIANP